MQRSFKKENNLQLRKIGAGCDEKAELLMRFGEKITKLEDCLHDRNNLQCDEEEIKMMRNCRQMTILKSGELEEFKDRNKSQG